LSGYVFDAFALVAYFRSEPGRERVEELLRAAVTRQDTIGMTVVNLGEVLYRIHQLRGAPASRRALLQIAQWPIVFYEIDRDLALNAAWLRAEKRLGYLDCFAAALGQALDAAVVTGDPGFRLVADEVLLDWLPQRAR
jgi:predicted nucleic acid-binding protein